MPEAKFVLKQPKSTEETLINLLFRFNYERLKFSTGEKIHPKFWNAKKQRAKETSQFPEYPEFNVRLNNIETAVNNSYRKLLNDSNVERVTPDLLKDELKRALKIEVKAKRPNLLAFIEKFIEQVTPNRKPGSIQVYKATLKHLKEFGKATRRKIDFDTINLDFYHDFVDYLSKEKGFHKNTEGKYVKNLKMFLNEATERGLNLNLEFKSRKFKVAQEDVDHIYLNSKDLQHLYSLDLSEKKPLERVRDLFLIGCHTGLRFSDFTQLKDNNLVVNADGRFFQVRTQKTKE
ncbi:MAG TPA: site-specific integrase, partial [Chitinophagales bacterium]|nr:site-specific integrase [Chitinophagales bacterium]